MAFLRAQARHLLHRMQGVCMSAEAATGSAPHSASLLQASRACSSVAAADGRTWQGIEAARRGPEPGSRSLWPLEPPIQEAAASPSAAANLLWTVSGMHSLRPAIAAALLSPSAGGSSALAPFRQPLADNTGLEWRDDAADESNSEGQPAGPVMELVKRTYQPSVIVRKRRHGLLSRLRSKGGQRVLERRRLKGRRKMTA